MRTSPSVSGSWVRQPLNSQSLSSTSLGSDALSVKLCARGSCVSADPTREGKGEGRTTREGKDEGGSKTRRRGSRSNGAGQSGNLRGWLLLGFDQRKGEARGSAQEQA